MAEDNTLGTMSTNAQQNISLVRYKIATANTQCTHYFCISIQQLLTISTGVHLHRHSSGNTGQSSHACEENIKLYI